MGGSCIMKNIFRLSLIALALFLAVAPVMSFAQSTTTGGSTTTTSSGPATTGGAAAVPGSSSTTDKSTSSDGSTTTTTTTTSSNVPWLWIAVGAIVIVAIVGIVAANGRNTTRIVS